MKNPAIAGRFTFCTPSIGGISRLWATPFVRMQLLYQLGERDIVADIANPLQWFEVQVDRDNDTFSETTTRGRNGIIYKPTISLFFPKMKAGTRKGVRALTEGKHAFIIQDTNGICHIAGFDTPFELVDYQASVDKFKGTNGYTLSLQCNSLEGIKPINSAYVRQRVENLDPVACPGIVLENESILYTISHCIVIPE